MSGGPTLFDTSRGVGGLNSAIKGSTGPTANLWPRAENEDLHTLGHGQTTLGGRIFVISANLKTSLVCIELT